MLPETVVNVVDRLLPTSCTAPMMTTVVCMSVSSRWSWSTDQLTVTVTLVGPGAAVAVTLTVAVI